MDKSDGVRWGVRRRLELIDFRLFWDRRFNRSDLAATFGISAQQASADIAQYENMAPGNLIYNRAEKAYLRASGFTPAFIGPSIDRYLLQLVAIENNWMPQEDTWFAARPPVEVVTLGRRRIDPGILLGVLDAIRDRHELDVQYSSITGPADSARVIAPHALAHGAGCWYVRAWSREHNDFRNYNLSRIKAVRDPRPSAVDPALDFEWIHLIDLVIVPNPGLPAGQQAAIALEYGMSDGQLRVPVRLSLSFFLMSDHNLDVDVGVLPPEKQQLVLQNRPDVDKARSAARQMSVQALSRAMPRALAGGRG